MNIHLFGHLGAQTGVGAAARGTASALGAAGLTLTSHDLDMQGPRPASFPGVGARSAEAAGAPGPTCHLFHANPDSLLEYCSSGGSALLSVLEARRANVGFWAWEAAEGIPEFWKRAFRYFGEIWVPSRFTAQAVAAHVPMPVVPFPHPVTVSTAVSDKQRFGIPADSVCFLNIFDALSNTTRKNPVGLINAWLHAFPEPGPGALLLIKANHLSPAAFKGLVQLIDGRGDVRIMNRALPADILGSLVASCDVYVSLHRSEGFGLTMAEAMAAGKPVIATGYSGNMDFMNERNSFLVPFQLTELDRQDGYHGRGTVWADPDAGQAARIIRHVRDNFDQAARVGRQAAGDIARSLSPQAVGRRMTERLQLLARERRL